MYPEQWLLLITSLPGRQGAQRVRLWRALKATGAAIVRDGVYVLPKSGPLEERLRSLVTDIDGAGGSASLLTVPDVDASTAAQWTSLFDRSDDYEKWTTDVATRVAALQSQNEAEARRAESRVRRAFEAIVAIDFFAGSAQASAHQVLEDFAAAINRQFSPDEPVGGPGTVVRRDRGDYSGRLWATRQGIWVDRIASAWLISRFIDVEARFLWLEHPGDCPDTAVGFDFDAAEFTHVGEQVTFEVLLQSFGLEEDPALKKLAALVHYADVGGLPVDDAAGLVAMFAGIKQSSADDDALLGAASPLLNYLYAAYQESHA